MAELFCILTVKGLKFFFVTATGLSTQDYM